VEPLAARPDPPDPIYETYYGLTEQPFAISTDPRFFYLGSSHEKAYTELLTGLKRDEGMLLLTGEAGTGKTTLCRAVIEALGERTFSAIILNPYMTGDEMLRLVIRDFGLVSREELRQGALAKADTPQLLDTLEGFLLSVRSMESRAVVVIDEAQSLAPRVLDHVRQLTALEKRGKRLLQIILSGQPMLSQTLKKDSMYALNERISRRVFLAPMNAGDGSPVAPIRSASIRTRPASSQRFRAGCHAG
jgi:general secretion pathway protein A